MNSIINQKSILSRVQDNLEIALEFLFDLINIPMLHAGSQVDDIPVSTNVQSIELLLE